VSNQLRSEAWEASVLPLNYARSLFPNSTYELNDLQADLANAFSNCTMKWTAFSPSVVIQIQVSGLRRKSLPAAANSYPAIPVQAAFSPKNRRNLVQLENMENEAAA